VETALFYNTLVCLPTGLGKTFISAIIMLNYYLWFPEGKLFFLAPTRPLVNQQFECLTSFAAIERDDIVEMTGSMQPY
jgi:ERCC4-related helicase